MTCDHQYPNVTSISETSPKDPSILYDRVQEYYRDRLENTWKGRHPMKGRTPGPNSIQMRTNDYLCLAGDQRIIEAEINALRQYGHGDAVSRVWLHHEKDIIRSFELRMAQLMQAEDGVLCSSGYTANVGLIQAIVKPDVPVYLDMLAHMSLWEGVVSAKSTAYAFRHNDSNHLERQVRKYGPGFIAVDALYSTNGSIAPLYEIIEIAEKYNCAVIVDETHSFGTHGPDGAGLVTAMGLSDRVQFRTVGLSKAVASRGGMIICSSRNAEFFRYEAYPAMFSTSVLKHEVAGYDAVLDVLKTDSWRREKLHRNHRYLVNGLCQLGYNVGVSKSQIIAVEAGEILPTVKLRDALEAKDVFGALYFPPATTDKRCFIRFTVNCGLTDPQINKVLEVCGDIRDEVNFYEWPSTKRGFLDKKKGEILSFEPHVNAA